jgi:hypothetical protein
MRFVSSPLNAAAGVCVAFTALVEAAYQVAGTPGQQHRNGNGRANQLDLLIGFAIKRVSIGLRGRWQSSQFVWLQWAATAHGSKQGWHARAPSGARARRRAPGGRCCTPPLSEAAPGREAAAGTPCHRAARIQASTPWPCFRVLLAGQLQLQQPPRGVAAVVPAALHDGGSLPGAWSSLCQCDQVVCC